MSKVVIFNLKNGIIPLFRILLYILAIYILGLSVNSAADAWLPSKGSYQYSSTFSTIDKKSKNSKNRRSSAAVKIIDEAETLRSIRHSIIDKALKEKRNLRHSEIRQIKTITKEIRDLDTAANMLSAFRDEHFAQFSVEYGASENQSFGVKLNYIIDKFAGYNDPNHNKQFIGKDADFFYKHQIFKNDKWVVSIKPTIQFSSYNSENSCKFLDIATFAGYSKEKENGNNLFHEFGFSFRKYFRNSMGDGIGYSASMMDGIKFKNGIILTNFTQYERTKLKNLIYSHTVYEQISIAKEFRLSKLIKNNLTTQIGYFWKSSLIGKNFTISGPILSIWLNV